MVTYEHEGVTYATERLAIFDEVWGLVDNGTIGVNTAHRMLGRYFGYPECCIDGFITEGAEGEVHDRFYCKECVNKEGNREHSKGH
jgi:hypothetical protein